MISQTAVPLARWGTPSAMGGSLGPAQRAGAWMGQGFILSLRQVAFFLSRPGSAEHLHRGRAREST
jgi:hypothetical protein